MIQQQPGAYALSNQFKNLVGGATSAPHSPDTSMTSCANVARIAELHIFNGVRRCGIPNCQIWVRFREAR